MSFLPKLEDIPKQRKLSVRMKLQQVFIEEIEHRDIYDSFRSSTCNSNSLNLLQYQPATPKNISENFNFCIFLVHNIVWIQHQP